MRWETYVENRLESLGSAEIERPAFKTVDLGEVWSLRTEVK